MQWHTTYEVQALVRQHQQDLQEQAEMHRRVKAVREQRRQQKLAQQQEQSSSRLVRVLNRALHPAR